MPVRNDEDKESPPRGYQAGGGLVPVPDPTKLTTDAVALARAEIEKLFKVQFDNIDGDIEKIEKALHEMPALDKDKRDALRELFDQKFVGVATEFTMRDIALAAAFKAAEAAVAQQNQSNTLAIDKAGTAFTKQIDGLDEKIEDLKDRITVLAAQITAITSRSGGGKDVFGYMFGFAGFLVAAATLAVLALRH